MELRLQKFIASTSQIADIRNLDPLNPCIFKLQHPVSGTEYVVVAALGEPTHLGIPINSTWVVLDPASIYYRRALKLKGNAATVVEGIDPLPGLAQSWIEVFTYADIFIDPQYYDMLAGEKGDKGDPGDRGDKGDPGKDAYIDLAELARLVAELIKPGAPSLVISGPPTVLEGTSANYTVSLFQNGSATPLAIPITLSAGAEATMDASNVMHVNPLSQSQNIELTAKFTPAGGQEITASLQVQLINADLQSLDITGVPAQVIEGASFTAVCTANYMGTTPQAVTPIWTVVPPEAGTITAEGVFTAAQVGVDTTFTIEAVYTEAAITKSASKASKVINIVPTGLTIAGLQTVFEGKTVQYTATATSNSGGPTVVTPTWSVTPVGAGAISASGLFTAASVSSDLTATIHASYVASGATVEADRTCLVKDIIPTSLALRAAAATINEGATTQLTATVTRNDGSTAQVTPASYTVTPSALGSVNASGLFTAAAVNATATASIAASYTEGTTTVTGSASVTITDIPVVMVPFYGAAATNSVKNEALIKSLTGRGPNNSRLNDSFVIYDGPGLSMFYAYPASYGLATFTDLGNGFQGGWDGAAGAGDGMTLGPITVTVDGTPWYLYKTDQANISPVSNPTNWKVT